MEKMLFCARLSSLLLTITALSHQSAIGQASRSASFNRFTLDKQRILSPYKTLENISGLYCSYVCGKDDECSAFNHKAATGSCELIDSLRNEKEETEDRSWTVYEKVRYTVQGMHLEDNFNSGVGSWTRYEFCPNGSFATAYTMKIQPFDSGNGWPPFPDNTALTAVKLTCQGQHGEVTGLITSGQANCEPGSWGTTTPCTTPDHYITSFKLQYDTVGVNVAGTTHLDQTAINYIVFRCRDLQNTTAEYEIVTPPGIGHTGDWLSWSNTCPPGEAVCGIRTRIEDAKPDCKGLVDVIFICCGVIYF